MAGTTIKGVGNSGNVQIPDMVTAAKQNAGTSFQAVWNKTQSNAQTTNAADGDRTQAGRNDVRRGESLRAGGRQRDNVADVSDGNKTMEDDSLDAKDLEKVQEVVGTVVQNLIQQITDTFSVSEEELQATMEDLGMTEVDLTDPGKLNELLMAVSGAQDSFALLTDENLYNDVKGIMDLQKELTGQAQEELQLSPEKWQEAVTQITQETVAEPVITVETDKTENVAVTTEESTVDTTEATVTQVPDSGEKVPVQNAQENRRFRQQTGTQRRWTAWQSVITESEGRQFPGTVTADGTDRRSKNRRYAGHYASDHGLYESIRQGGQL